MAIRDVKHYYYTMQNQYLLMKADLKDFEEGLKSGYITEDQLTEFQEDVARVEQNFLRLGYIMFLLEQPNKASKKDGYIKQNKKLTAYFEDKGATIEKVVDENFSAIQHIREEIKKLSDKTNKTAEK